MKCLICGMNIDINNFNLNKGGLLESNESDDIKYCPFCGVGATYLKQEGEMNKVLAESLDENTLTILDHAMKLEIFNSEFYKAAAKLAQNFAVKEIFQALSKIEYVHAIVHQKLGGFKQMPTLVTIDYSKYKSDKCLMELAENREIHAALFYEKQAKKVNNSIVREVFSALGEVERGHIQIARNY